MSVWRDDPALKDRFHPDFPDDVQVLVHEGSFRFTDKRPELMWVHITAKMQGVMQNGETLNWYKGILLNQPHHLQTVKLHQELYFFAYKDYQYPIRVTPEYLGSRSDWEITPCNNCGLPEVFDPIPELHKKSFPNMPELEEGLLMVFNSFCPMCGNQGQLVLKQKGVDEAVEKGKQSKSDETDTDV